MKEEWSLLAAKTKVDLLPDLVTEPTCRNEIIINSDLENHASNEKKKQVE